MPPLKGALVGFGKAAEQSHLPAYGGDFRIIAVVEPDPDRQEVASLLLPGVHLYETSRHLWRREHPAFVDVCTPPAFHASAITEALDHGAHVLCEKPLVVSDEELRAVRRHATERVVSCVHNWKYSPQFQKVFELLPGLGEVRYFEWHAERVSSDSGAASGSASWRRDPRIAGGGVLLDHGWHAAYLAIAVIGRPPQAVSTDVFSRSSPSGVEDRVSTTLHFEGAQARLHLSWNSTRRYNGGKIEGTRGSVGIEDQVLRAEGRSYPFPEALSQQSIHPDWFPGVLDDFRREIEEPGRAGTSLKEAALCLQVVDAAYVSGREGGRLVPL